MFNIFNKKNEGNKDDCYLIKSGVLEQKTLDEDNLDHYNDILRDVEVDQQFKDLIRYFLIPYKISILKFSLNQEYYQNPYPIDFENNHRHIAPSLKKIKENPLDVAMGYPSWFFIAFPDVALWAMKGEGVELVVRKFKNFSEEELVEGNYIRTHLLNDIIKLYQSNTNKPLECKLY
jgi:hypothetical protein